MRTSLAVFVVLVLAGCSAVESISSVGASLGQAAGFISRDEANAVRKTGKAMDRAVEDITPEQEYYIGRSVGANLLARYKACDNPQANMYVNQLGQTLAAASDRPQTFCGYHFLILDSDEINAFAAPSGLIFVTRGLIRCCRTEDQLAAVLAHEVGHAQNQDAKRAIKTARLTTALAIMGTEAAKTYGGRELAALTESFDESIQDIVHEIADKGYSRKVEFQADAAAVEILRRVGYDPNALLDILAQMEKLAQPEGPGFSSTHPSPSQRIGEAVDAMGESDRPAGPSEYQMARQQRFAKALAGI